MPALRANQLFFFLDFGNGNVLKYTNPYNQQGAHMFCKKCGTDVGDSKFCPKCGEAVSGDQSAGEPVSAGQPVKKVNKVAYALLAFFLGGIGIHRFYAGKVLSGVIYLLFCWTLIPGIIAFIEFILALIRESDENGNLPVYQDKFFV